MFIYSKPDICFSNYKSRDIRSPSIYPYTFAYGRSALKFGLQVIGIKPTDRILVPGLICNVVVDPPFNQSFIPIFYDLDEYLNPDWNKLEALLKMRPVAIMMVHYFGYPQEVEKFLNFSRGNRLYLIEDNAHGFGSHYNGQALGSFGDISITSVRKKIGIFNGSILNLKNGRNLIGIPDSLPLEPLNPLSKGVSNKIKYFLKGSRLVRRSMTVPLYQDPSAFPGDQVEDWSIDEQTWKQIVAVDLAHLLRKRQEIYSIWKDWAEGLGMRPVFSDLPNGYCPLSMPVYLAKIEKREALIQAGFRVGVDIHSWPRLPNSVLKEMFQVITQWNKMLCFPIHQEIDSNLLRNTLKKIELYL